MREQRGRKGGKLKKREKIKREGGFWGEIETGRAGEKFGRQEKGRNKSGRVSNESEDLFQHIVGAEVIGESESVAAPKL